MQRYQIMNKLTSANYWFGCDWCFCEVGYLCRHARQLSLTCAVVYLWNTGCIWVTCLGMETHIRKPSTKPLNGLLPPLGILLGNISSPDSQLSTSLGDLKRLLLIPSSQTPLPLTLVLPWPRILLEKEL